jgi:hypothetical protein
MARGDERSAERWIARCQHADTQQQHSWNMPARLTVGGLRGVLAELTRIGNINGTRPAEAAESTVDGVGRI